MRKNKTFEELFNEVKIFSEPLKRLLAEKTTETTFSKVAEYDFYESLFNIWLEQNKGFNPENESQYNEFLTPEVFNEFITQYEDKINSERRICFIKHNKQQMPFKKTISSESSPEPQQKIDKDTLLKYCFMPVKDIPKEILQILDEYGLDLINEHYGTTKYYNELLFKRITEIFPNEGLKIIKDTFQNFKTDLEQIKNDIIVSRKKEQLLNYKCFFENAKSVCNYDILELELKKHRPYLNDYIDLINNELKNIESPEPQQEHKEQKKRIEAPTKAAFCYYVNLIGIIKQNNDSAQNFCKKVCDKYNIKYAERIRENYHSAMTPTSKQIKNIQEQIFPLIDTETVQKISELINK